VVGVQRKSSGAERITQERPGISPETGNFLHRLQRIPEQEANSAPGTEKIGEHREFTPLYPGKEERRTTGSIHSPLNSSYLQRGVNLTVNTDKFTVTLKVMDTFQKIAVPHEKVSFSGSIIVVD
jgi:hypothetical protein